MPKRFLVLSVLGLALFCNQVQSARAQGPTRITQQTDLVQVFNAVSCAPHTQLVSDIGQSVGYVLYSTNLSGVTSIDIRIEGSPDNFASAASTFSISGDATNVAGGAVQSNLWMPYMRARIVSCTSTGNAGTVTAWFGKGIMPGFGAGTFNTSGILDQVLAVGANATLTPTYSFTSPTASSAGTIFITAQTGTFVAGGTLAVFCGGTSGKLATITPAPFLQLAAGTNATQAFPVPSFACTFMQVLYSPGGGQGAATYDLEYAFYPQTAAAAQSILAGLTAGEAVTSNQFQQLASEPILYADQFPGANMGAKIAAGIAALPGTGGEVVVSTSGAVSSTINVSIANVHLHLNAGVTLAATSAVAGSIIHATNTGFVLDGADKASSKITVACGTAATVDGVLVDSTSHNITSGGISNIGIISAGACAPGRYNVHLTIVTNGLTHFNIDNIDTGFGANVLGSYSIFQDNAAPVANGYFESQIKNSVICNGIQLNNAGDTIQVLDNKFDGYNCTGTTTTLPGLEASFVNGASTFIVKGNNITFEGGCIKLGAYATAPIVAFNECEDKAGGAGSNGAMIDLAGAAAKKVIGAEVTGNRIQITAGTGINGLRCDYCTNVHIVGNYFGRDPAAVDIVNTANSAGLRIGVNDWEGGATLANIITDAGTNTTLTDYVPGNFNFTNTGGGPSILSLVGTQAGAKNYSLENQCIGVSNTGVSIHNYSDGRSEICFDTNGLATFFGTVNTPAYQTATIPAYVFVTGDFTTSGAGTALEAITGLTWTMPLNTALNIPFSCHLIYHQNVAVVAVAFGIQDTTTAPTQINAQGVQYTNLTVPNAGNLIGLNTTTATAITSATPSAITTNWNADLNGMIEQPSGAASAITIRVSTAVQADTVTVKRGSFCKVG